MSRVAQTLAQFLKLSEMVETFRREVFLHLSYLRWGLGGDAFFTEEGWQKEHANIRPGVIHDREYWEILHQKERLAMPPWVSDLGEKIATTSDAARKELTFQLIMNHFRELESFLLGARYRTRPGRKTFHAEERVVPLGPNTVVPFAALLGEERVSFGEGGCAGGFTSTGGVGGAYSTPMDGQTRFFPTDLMNDRLIEFWDAGMHSRERQTILAGADLIRKSRWDTAFPYASSADGRTLHYTGVAVPNLQAPVVFSNRMPNDAVYIVDPKAVLIHAPSLCKVTCDDKGNILRLHSRVAHSLFHFSAPDYAKRLEGRHAAFLSVRNGPREEAGGPPAS